MSALLSFGTLMCLLEGLNLTGYLSLCLPVLFILCVLSEAASWNRITALAGLGLAAAALILWLSVWNGASVLSDLLRVFSLSVRGLLSSSLPLISREAALFLTVISSLCGFACSRRSMGSVPSLMLSVITLVLLWLGNRPDLMLYLLPPAAASFLLLLRDRHRELSPARVLPWAAALVGLAFLLTPPAGIVSPPLKEKADELRQTIMDRLFFTEPRDVFSLSSYGYYPEGISQLGGPVNPSDQPVLQVSTPREVYLRGVIMNEYDGRCWKNTLGGRRFLWDSPTSASGRIVLFDQSLPSGALNNTLTEAMDVSVRMLSDSASTLFLPQRIRELRAGGELVPYFSNSSEVFVTRNLLAGDTWSASAPLFTAGDPGLGTLVDAAQAAEDPQFASVTETYTRLPAHLEEPVWQLALDTVSGLDSEYNKAFAIQNMLSRSFRYTLQVEEQPPSLDFVTNFLFNTKEGYCTYFASAMTVLCRMAGLPARYVEGFLARPNAQGEAIVSGLDAHAWTEVYFKGFGWLTFDATPRQENGNHEDPSGGDQPSSSPEPTPEPTPEPSPEPSESPSAAPEDPTPTPEAENPGDAETPAPEDAENSSTPTPTPTPTPAPSPAASADDATKDKGGDSSDNSSFSFPFLPVLFLLLLILAVVLRWIMTSPAHKEKRAANESARFDIWLQETVDCLAARKIFRANGETPMSWTRNLDASGELPVSLSRLGECVSLLRYGKLEAVPDDTALARESAQALKKGMNASSRIRYALRRFFLPGSRKPGF